MPSNDRTQALEKLSQISTHCDYIIDYYARLRGFFEDSVVKVERMLLMGHENPQPHVKEAARKQAEERYMKYLKAIEYSMQLAQMLKDTCDSFRREL